MGKNTVELTDANFAATVEQSDVPVLVDFWAPWCGPCRLVAPVVEELAETYSGRMRVGKLNTDDNPAVASQFNIRSIPTLLFFKNGQVVDHVVGAVPREKLQKKVDEILGA
jgi:thioredoxin 1